MTQSLFFDELIEELGTQSLARFGLNIFNVDSYGAYMESSKLTTSMQKAVKQHGSNPNGFGQMFEAYEVGKQNIKNAYNKNDTRAYTTDELKEIKQVYENKDFDKNNEIKKAMVTSNFSKEEIKSIATNPKLDVYAKTNHTLVDVVGVDKNGNVVKEEQLKAVGESIFRKKFDKYFEAGVKVRVDSDTYERAENKIKQIRQNLENAPEDKKAIIQKQLDEKQTKFKQLEKGSDRAKSGYIKGEIQENGQKTNTDGKTALKTVYLEQAKQAGINIAQTGLSDAGTVVLSTFASGVVWELRDEYLHNNHEDFLIRLQRLLKQVFVKGSESFGRGASFGLIDTILGLAAQCLKNIGGNLRAMWTSLRNSAKSIFNAIWQFIKGEIKSFSQLIRTILKSLFSAIMVAFGFALGRELSVYVGNVLATGISILVCSVGVVVFSQSLDLAINGFLAICAKAEMAKKRREEVEALYHEIMPKMIENRLQLEAFTDEYIANLKDTSELSFADISSAMANNDYSKADEALIKLAGAYGVNDLFVSQKEFDDFMLSDEPLKL